MLLLILSFLYLVAHSLFITHAVETNPLRITADSEGAVDESLAVAFLNTFDKEISAIARASALASWAYETNITIETQAAQVEEQDKQEVS